MNTRYRLTRALTTSDFERLGHLSTEYGIRELSIEGEDLIVEYDASRMHEAEVLSAVRKAGVPVVPLKPIPAGAFDYTGEFRDFSWPVEGLSPANPKN